MPCIDATVLYSLVPTNLWLHADLKVNSPYNTYFTPACRPPIACPGKASIQAALHRKNTIFYTMLPEEMAHVMNSPLPSLSTWQPNAVTPTESDAAVQLPLCGRSC